MKQIFPKEIILNTVDVHRFKHKVSSNIIYGIILLSFIGSFLALPFVYFDIYSSARGILKAEKERNEIFSLYAGKVKAIYIQENQTVKTGDTLFVLDNTVELEKLRLITYQMKEIKSFVFDLTYLSKTSQPTQDSMLSILYQKQFIQYSQKLHELQTRYAKSKRDFRRQRKLYDKNIIAKAEYENSRFQFDLTIDKLSHFKKRQRNQWQIELIQQTNKLKELQSTSLQYKKKQQNYTILATIPGTIQNLKGLEIGNFITSSTPIAEISPDTELIAECYIKPSDIGLLKNKVAVKLQVDAFNYNQWGMVTGKVISVNKDISFVNSIPMFKVICSVDQKYLQLKNGFKGELKKGMTLNARFFIANRSAINLLYDKVDDWFDPSIR